MAETSDATQDPGQVKDQQLVVLRASEETRLRGSLRAGCPCAETERIRRPPAAAFCPLVWEEGLRATSPWASGTVTEAPSSPVLSKVHERRGCCAWPRSPGRPPAFGRRNCMNHRPVRRGFRVRRQGDGGRARWRARPARRLPSEPVRGFSALGADSTWTWEDYSLQMLRGRGFQSVKQHRTKT